MRCSNAEALVRSCSVSVLRNTFTGKHLCQSLFINKVASVQIKKETIKKETLAQVFSCKFAKFQRTLFLTEHLQWLLLHMLSSKTSQYSQENTYDVFSREFCETFQNSFFIERLWCCVVFAKRLQSTGSTFFLCEHIDHNHIPASLKLKVKFLEPKFNGQRKFLQRIKKQPFVDVLQNMEASIGGVL